MGLFERFPYTNFHELNSTWIIEELFRLKTTIEQFVSINALKYADPIQWNIVSQYEKNTIVIDPLTGTAYISVQPVPSGVAITNTDYWTVVFDLGSFVVRAAKNFTDNFEEETTLTATFPSSVNDWLVWGDILYRVISPIVAGDQYVIGSNIVHFTAEDIIGHIQDLNTTDKSNLVAAINDVLQTLTDTAGDLDSLNTTDKSNLVAAINEVLQYINDVVTRLDNYITPDYFTGTDTQKMQAAFDFFNTPAASGVLIINRKYQIDADLTIDHFAGTSADHFVTVLGLGKECTIDMGTHTIKSATANFRGGFSFENVHFTGTGDLFNTNMLIRMKFINCRFENFDHVINAQNILQQYYFTNCYFESNNDTILLDTTCYGLSFVQCDFEHNNTVLSMTSNGKIVDLIFNGCILEYCTGTAIKINSYLNRGTKIVDCYFENNPLSIDLSEVISGQYCIGMEIMHNVFNIPTDGTAILIPGTTYKLSSYESMKIVIMRDNTTLPNASSNTTFIGIYGTLSNHSVWYDMDVLDMGYAITSDLFKVAHQYKPMFHQFTYTLANNASPGDTVVLLSSADLLALTGTTQLEYIIGSRNGYFPAVFNRGNSGDIYATILANTAAGAYTFNIVSLN